MSPLALTQDQLALIQKISREQLAQSINFKIWVFGSRAKGSHRPYSDLDLLIEAEPPLTHSQKNSLEEAFEESDLPFKVDIVLIDELLDAYRNEVLAERKLLFSAK